MRNILITMCCVALLSASVAQAAYLDDFESYTVPEDSYVFFDTVYGSSGWEHFYEIGIGLRTSTRVFDPPYATSYSGQGIYAGNADSGDARPVDASLRTANSTVGVQAKFNQLDNNKNSALWLGDDSMVASGTTGSSSAWSLAFCLIKGDGRGYFQYRHNGVTVEDNFQPSTGAGGWYGAGWFELRIEMDLDANSRPTDTRLMWRDFDSGAGDALDWIQLSSGTFTATGADWTPTHTAFQGGQWNTMDDFVLTPEPATLAVLSIGAVLMLSSRRRK